MNQQNEKQDLDMVPNVLALSKDEKMAMIDTLMNIGHFIE
jgi:hypothetical protein